MIRFLLTFLLVFLTKALLFTVSAQGKITWPEKDNMIFQRYTWQTNNGNYNKAPIEVYGYFDQAVTEVRVSFIKVAVPNNDLAQTMTDLPLGTEGNNFSWGFHNPRDYGFLFPLIQSSPSGKTNFKTVYKVYAGYYDIVVKGLFNGTWITLPSRRIGVGDVFIIAGQSNAAGDVSVLNSQPGNALPSSFTTDAGGMVQFDNKKLEFDGNDPKNGQRLFPWFWRRLGALLVESEKVPVSFLQAAWSGTSVRLWAESANNPNGQSLSDYGPFPFPTGQPFRNLQHTLQDEAPMSNPVIITGARCVLWQQGENDTQFNTSKINYRDRLNTVIAKSRSLWNLYNYLPWMIARSSYNNGTTNQNVIDAQNEVIGSHYLNYAGPETDAFQGNDYRINVTNNTLTHFNINGMEQAAQAWKNALVNNADFRYRISVLGNPPIVAGYSSGRLSAEYVNDADISSFAWKNQTTGQTVNGVNYIDNPTPGIWTGSFHYSDGRPGRLMEIDLSTSNCSVASPVNIGSWNGYSVQLMQFDGQRTLVTVLPGGPNGTNKLFARGRNFWNSVSRNANTDQYFNCITVGETGYGGLALPFDLNYTPAGYSKGTEQDGAVYYYQGGCSTPAAPSLSANPGNIQSGQTSTLSASGCNGTLTYFDASTNNPISSSVGVGSYYARCSVNGCVSGNSNIVTVTQGNNPCALTSPVNIGSWNGYSVQLMQFDGQRTLVTVLPGGPNGTNKLFARGRNFWNSVSRNANTDQYFNCITVGETGYGGLALPFDLNYTPAGYSKGTEQDGAVYYYTLAGGRIASTDQPKTDDLTVFANPNDGNFQVSAYVTPRQSATLSVTDLQGRNWIKKTFIGEGQQTHLIQLKGRLTGTVVISLESGTHQLSKRVLIQP